MLRSASPGEPISLQAPTLNGTPPLIFNVHPPLPHGLHLNYKDGSIQGSIDYTIPLFRLRAQSALMWTLRMKGAGVQGFLGPRVTLGVFVKSRVRIHSKDSRAGH